MQLHELKSPKGSRKKKRIIGRGQGSGSGKTSGRGENGQRSRSGRWTVGGSEGGQSPLIRRLAKVGFRSKRPILNQIVTLDRLSSLKEGTIVTAELLKKEGLINSINKPFKILGNGEIKQALVFQTESMSATARDKIIKAGGKIEESKEESSRKLSKKQLAKKKLVSKK
ncbi:MAG: 50S ribosomal protein L15 [Candidatus Zapsychrus exili]|nr:50S ribosomal protein L15 [Candidatus Zapsychrus exili]